MRIITAFVCALMLGLLSGCTGTVYYTCGSPYFNEVVSETNIDCGRFNENAKVAFDMLAQAGFVPHSYDHDFHRVHVTIESQEWHLDDSSDYDGDYTLNEIHVTLCGEALLHEMLHHWQLIHWILDTGKHPHWRTNGYMDLGDSYSNWVVFSRRCLG